MVVGNSAVTSKEQSDDGYVLEDSPDVETAVGDLQGYVEREWNATFKIHAEVPIRGDT